MGCEDGACRVPVCQPGATVCVGSRVSRCRADGSALDVVDDCGAAGCVGGACGRVCEPGDRFCVGSEARACDAAGREIVVTDRCTADEVCADGACRPHVCDAGDVECDGADVIGCRFDETGWSVWQTCPAGCAYGRCLPEWPLCPPGTRGCEGAVATVCADDGAAWLPAEDCAALGACVDGRCVDPAGVAERWPFDNARLVEARPTLLWQVPDRPADPVELQLATRADFAAGSVEVDVVVPGATWTPDIPLGADMVWWWRVRPCATATGGCGAWSAALSFTIRPDAATTPGWLQASATQLARGAAAGVVCDAEDVGCRNPANVVLTSDGLDEGDYVAIESEAPAEAPEQVIASLARRADLLRVGAAAVTYRDGTERVTLWDAGLRFPFVPIPPGAPLDRAILCLRNPPDAGAWAADVTVVADRSASGAPWWPGGPGELAGSTVLEGFEPTAASVAFTAGTPTMPGTCVPSPAITAVVQEAVDAPGWQEGQALRLLLLGGRPTGAASFRTRTFALAGNELRLQFPRQATLLSPPIPFTAVAGATGWAEVRWRGEGDVRLRVHDAYGAPLSSYDLTGNFAGFTGGVVSLAALDPAEHPVLRLGATLTRPDDTTVGRLLEWQVRWTR